MDELPSNNEDADHLETDSIAVSTKQPAGPTDPLVDEALVVEVYKAYIEDVNQLRAGRGVQDTIYVTILTIVLGAQGYIANSLFSGSQLTGISNTGIASWVPVVMVIAIGVVGYTFCGNWQRITRDNQRSISFKFKNLESMERRWPVLKSVGAQLFLEEYYDRHPERRPAMSASVEPGGTPVSSAKAANRGVAARARDLQILFRNVFVLLGVAVFMIKLAAVVRPIVAFWLKLPLLQ